MNKCKEGNIETAIKSKIPIHLTGEQKAGRHAIGVDFCTGNYINRIIHIKLLTKCLHKVVEVF